ncbi:YecA/YgfB family protein [Zophobihabitans entericus]|nr:YecA family protein [Zophobihabitans entericus]
MSENTDYEQLNEQLKSYGIGMNASELHGFITGMLAGGNKDDSWKTLLNDMVNDGQPLVGRLAELTQKCYESTKEHLEGSEFDFQILLSERDLFTQIDDLVGWVNHYLLGLGLVQPQLTKVKGDVKEAINDLRQITALGYDAEEDDPEDLAYAFEEVSEYVRVAVMLCHDEFTDEHSSNTVH